MPSNKRRHDAAVTIQKYARRLIVYQTIEFPVDYHIGWEHSASNPDAVSRYYEKQWEMFKRTFDSTEMGDAFVPEKTVIPPEEENMYTRRRQRGRRR